MVIIRMGKTFHVNYTNYPNTNKFPNSTALKAAEGKYENSDNGDPIILTIFALIYHCFL